jgi:hypothetical protein
MKAQAFYSEGKNLFDQKPQVQEVEPAALLSYDDESLISLVDKVYDELVSTYG